MGGLLGGGNPLGALTKLSEFPLLGNLFQPGAPLANFPALAQNPLALQQNLTKLSMDNLNNIMGALPKP